MIPRAELGGRSVVLGVVFSILLPKGSYLKLTAVALGRVPVSIKHAPQQYPLLGFRAELSGFAVSGVFFGLVHHITAIIFPGPTVGAANHLMVNLNKLLFFQIDSPCINGADDFCTSVSSSSSYYHISWCLGIEAAKLEVL